MSNVKIRQALEPHILALGYPVAWENVNFNPPTGAYIQVDLFFAEPADAGFRDSPFIQPGYLQLTLCFPTNQGPGPAERLAESIRDETFFRSASFTVDDVDVIIDRTPAISKGQIEETRFVVRVYIYYSAQVGA
jgi:hypothetical protein